MLDMINDRKPRAGLFERISFGELNRPIAGTYFNRPINGAANNDRFMERITYKCLQVNCF